MDNDTTIGMDLGNAKHVACALDADGNALFLREVANEPEALSAFSKEHAGAPVAMDTGTCCRFVSSLARSRGGRPPVGNARKLAVVTLAMLRSGRPYDDALAARFEAAA